MATRSFVLRRTSHAVTTVCQVRERGGGRGVKVPIGSVTEDGARFRAERDVTVGSSSGPPTTVRATKYFSNKNRAIQWVKEGAQ